jgi:predicted MFS family arabinose efflux permease
MSAIQVAFPYQRARLAVMTAFFINGALFANWVSRIPTIQTQLNMSEGTLGLVLLGLSVGVICALTLAGGLITRFGSRTVTFIGGLSIAAVLPLLALMPTSYSLAAILFLFGATMSLMDVAMNTQASAVEKLAERPMMSSFHATFSIGGLVGALVGVGMVAAGLSPLVHFSIVSSVGVLLILWAQRDLLMLPEEGNSHSTVFQLPPPALWGLGAIAFCSAIGEGAMADWGGVYMEGVVGATSTIAALGYAAFSLTMTAGRLAGDRLVSRYAPSLLVRGGGLLAGVGLVLAIVFPWVPTTLLGFALVGAGLSIAIPLVFSAAGHVPDLPPGTGIAGVATIGYAGFLAGPPVIGLVAEATSLQVGLGIVALLAFTLVLTGRAIR